MTSSLRQTIKSIFPFVSDLAAGYRRFRRWLRTRKLERQSRKDVFSGYYKTNQWGDKDSRSGVGSNLDTTEVVRNRLPEISRQYGVSTLVDVPCGDFFWMKSVDFSGIDNFRYVGCDIVPDMIAANQNIHGDDRHRFVVLDACVDAPPKGDLIFCRDCLVHLSIDDVILALGNFLNSGSTYLLTTTYPETPENADIVSGLWRTLNLSAPPFNFPEPILVVNENYMAQEGRYRDKSLGLWAFDDIAPRIRELRSGGWRVR